MAAAAFSVCAMVAAATTFASGDRAAATATEPTADRIPQAGRFVGVLDVRALRDAARAMDVAEPEPTRAPAPVTPEVDPPAEPAEPRRQRAASRPAGPATGGGSQFLAALVKRPPSRTPGTLVARARGGTCRFWIDGVVSGEGRVVKVPAAPGPHNVACRGADGQPRVQRVDVLPGGIAVAAFHLGG